MRVQLMLNVLSTNSMKKEGMKEEMTFLSIFLII